jgi:hypothetical protein
MWRAANVMSNKRYKWGNQKLGCEGRPTLAVLQMSASDYLIFIFHWTLHWPSFTFQLLITSFVSFIGHYIDRPSYSSFWLPHLYLLLDITLTVLHIPASDYLICIFYWTLHWPSFKFQLLITSFVTFIGHYIGSPSNSSFWLPHLYLFLDITFAIIYQCHNRYWSLVIDLNLCKTLLLA